MTATDIQSRRKNTRLVGADVYVVRLPRPDGSERRCAADDGCGPEAGTPPSAGSLHNDPLRSSGSSPARGDAGGGRSAAESRPCYRCVAQMHAVGVKRAFWTNASGEWEGAKVRDMMEMGQGLGGGLKTIYVTRHEVLMLLRRTGNL